MASEADVVASVVQEEFRKLPAKRKPAVRDNGLREWVPLSGIVVRGPDFLRCVALATGMKCLPASKLPQANGVALHDWHAEVLTIRAFNRFLLDECRRLAQDSTAQSAFLRRRTQEELSSTNGSDPWHSQPFAWREGLSLHMYCSEAPCGDASMELIMSAQEDATPWTIPPSLSPSATSSAVSTATSTTATAMSNPNPDPSQSSKPGSNQQTDSVRAQSQLLGRGYFSHLGIVRRKPARGDAPPTSSKSCSDKLALKQCTSLLCSLTSLFVAPERVYLTSLILPESQFSEAACRRCFSAGTPAGGSTEDDGEWQARTEGRMAPVRGKVWEGTGYAFNPFRVETTEREFEFSRRGIQASIGKSNIKMIASNLAVAWTKDGEVEEGLIGGVLQGRKAFDLKGASLTSRMKMWAAAVEIGAALGAEGISEELAKGSYDGVKDGVFSVGRRRVKEEVRQGALKGWLRNTGDGGFSL
ncbi:hypothetical protein VTI74DRAFT_9930 [Chaetomium olivicolor]